jgi:hypothetical protein
VLFSGGAARVYSMRETIQSEGAIATDHVPFSEEGKRTLTTIN